MTLAPEHRWNTSRQTYLHLALIIVLGMVTWLNPDSFLWRDDWGFLSYYFQDNFSLFKDDPSTDVKPLFQYLIYFEFFAFRDHFFLYQAVNTSLLIACSLCFYKILQRLPIDKTLSLLISLFFLLHPDNFINVLWISQQAELVHILFILIGILFFQKYLSHGKQSDRYSFFFSLLIQNYFFPNGIFLPLIFIVVYVVMKKREAWEKKFLIPAVGVFIFNFAYGFYIQSISTTEVIQAGAVLSDIPEKIIYLLQFISVSAWRIVVPNFKPQASVLINLLPFFILCGPMAILYKNPFIQKHKAGLLLGISGAFFSSIILSLTRYKQIEIHYYYTGLIFFYLCVILAIYLEFFLIRFRKGMIILMIVILAGQAVISFQSKQIFALRNTANQMQIEHAIHSNNIYNPVDDPSFNVEGFLILDGSPASESSVRLYQFLKK